MRDLLGLVGISATTVMPLWAGTLVAAAIAFAIVYRRLRAERFVRAR